MLLFSSSNVLRHTNLASLSSQGGSLIRIAIHRYFPDSAS